MVAILPPRLVSGISRPLQGAIGDHNRIVVEQRNSVPVGHLHRKTLSTINKDLLQEIVRLKAEQNRALSQIAVWEAEATQHKRENQQLKKKLDRFKSLQGSGLFKV